MNTFISSRARTVLALQGGGAHGAFTWGALDRLLEEGLVFDAVTGVSSGAIIGAMAVQGMVKNGPEGARAAISRLWTKVMEGNLFGNVPATPLDWMWDTTKALSNDLAWSGLTQALRLFDPAQLNPLGQNPLEPLLRELLDITALRAPSAPRLYASATDVESGEATIFTNAQIGVPELLASACIPMMFPTVKIGGRHYWDGGYSCNPALAPVLTPRPDRLILIRAQPRQRRGVPSSTADIVHRLHEIAFQAPLAAELSMLPRQVRLLDIPADQALARHPLTSKLNTDRPFLEMLFSAGREAAAHALLSA
ncbi:patatin-like phospholipase family protein [Acidocella sp.]|uniref:patatin-like phospholipase family protein n=1 Tax=Acidocella sp. TaxID=50710 RepID=UPI003CFC5D5D